MANKNVWVTDGVTLKLYADDVLVVELPFGSLAAPASVFLGQDTATGLPMWSPVPASTSGAATPPAPVTSTFGQPDPTADPPTTVPPDLDRICGAAQALATALILAANVAIKYLNSVLNRLLTLAGDLLQALFKEIALQASVLVAEEVISGGLLDAVTVFGDVVLALATAIQLIGSLLPLISGTLPPLGDWSGQAGVILCTAYVSLQESTDGTGATGNYVTPTTMLTGTLPTKTIWINNLNAHTSSFAGAWQTALLVGIVQATPDWAWEYLAQQGANLPSHVCVTRGCV